MHSSNRSKNAQKKVVEEKLKEMLEWYAVSSGGKFPKELCVDDQGYKGKGIVLRWLEPVLPMVDNPVLVEESLGDSWTLRFDPMQKKISLA